MSRLALLPQKALQFTESEQLTVAGKTAVWHL